MTAAESPAERTLRARAAAHTRWAHEPNRTAVTEPGRQGLQARFEREVDPGGVLTPAERVKRAESARKAFFADLARKSAAARRKRKAA
ncbi:MAG: hypothetical protein ABW046_07060 [Actinoplanes sp.]